MSTSRSSTSVPVLICPSRDRERARIEDIERRFAIEIGYLDTAREEIAERHRRVDDPEAKRGDIREWSIDVADYEEMKAEALREIGVLVGVMAIHFKAACVACSILEVSASSRLELVEAGAQDLLRKWKQVTEKMWELEDEERVVDG